MSAIGQFDGRIALCAFIRGRRQLRNIRSLIVRAGQREGSSGCGLSWQRSSRDQLTIGKVDDPVAFLGKVEVVRDDQEAGSFILVHLPHEIEHIIGRLAVEIAGRFVCENEIGPHRQRPRNRHTLLLSAGHVGGHMVAYMGKAHFLKQVSCTFLYSSTPGVAIDNHRHHDIFEGREGRNKVVLLKHEPDCMAPQSCEGRIAKVRSVRSVNEDLPGSRPVKQADDVKQSTFSGTGWSHQREKLAVIKVKVDAVQNFNL